MEIVKIYDLDTDDLVGTVKYVNGRVEVVDKKAKKKIQDFFTTKQKIRIPVSKHKPFASTIVDARPVDSRSYFLLSLGDLWRINMYYEWE